MSAVPASAPDASAPAQVTPAPQQEVGHKVFAGNLAYVTTDEGLKSFFAPVAGDILSAQVIQRGTRSAGYGFVSFSSISAAEKAVVELAGKELDGRALIIEIAKPSEDKDKERSERRSKKRTGGRRGAKAPPGEVTEAEANGQVEKVDEPVAPAPTTVAAEGEEPKAKKSKKPRKPRNKKKTEGEVPVDGEIAPAAPAANAEPAAPKPAKRARAPKVERAPRPEGEVPTGEPSKSVVFVANLAFNVDDEALGEVFTSAGIKVVSARVVRRRWGQPRRSKGYGFVDVGDEEQQKKAVELVQGKEVSGREIAVKIAVNAPHGSEAGGEESSHAEPAIKREASPETTVLAT